MDLSPPQRHQELRDGLSALVASHVTPEGDARDPSEPGDDPGLWPDLVSGGWVSFGFPEASGGRGGGVGDLVVVAETLGGGHVATPFQGGIVLCGQALLATPGEGDRLRALLTGERTFTYCNWEGFDEPGERAPAVVATETPSGWRLDGSARFVPYGDDVDELDDDELPHAATTSVAPTALAASSTRLAHRVRETPQYFFNVPPCYLRSGTQRACALNPERGRYRSRIASIGTKVFDLRCQSC